MMHRMSAVAAGFALTLGSLAATAPAYADKPTSEPCAKEQAQVEKAETALARVTLVFERQKAKVVKAKKQVEKADTANEKAQAKKKLAKAKKSRAEAAKVKKAQVQRVAKAEARLADCEAEAQA